MYSYVLTFVFFVGVCSASPASRIVAGTPTNVQTYPSIVQLDFFNPTINTWNHNCGASILNQLYLVSAAHCTDVGYDQYFQPEFRRIRAGATNRNSGGVIRNVASVVNHPEYTVQNLFDADICIIRLAQLLTFGSGISGVSILPQNFVIPNNAPVIHAGWGAVGATQPPSPVLLFVNLVHQPDCGNISSSFITEYMICAGSPTGGIEGACSGDSGGPLYFAGILAGVMSFTAGCDVPSPSVSARIPAFTNWILANTP